MKREPSETDDRGTDQAELFPELAPSRAPVTEAERLRAPLSEIAPGVWVSGLPEFETPSHVLCKLVPGETAGTYTLAPEPYPGYVRLTDDFGKRLGVLGLSDTTLRRLMWGGFIEHMRLAPGCIFVSIESLLEHFRATRNDYARERSFWTAARRAEWRATIDGGNAE